MLGYPSGLEQKYFFGDSLGKGGFGAVREAKRLSDGQLFACKSINKVLELPGVSDSQLQQHLDNIKREVRLSKEADAAVTGPV